MNNTGRMALRSPEPQRSGAEAISVVVLTVGDLRSMIAETLSEVLDSRAFTRIMAPAEPEYLTTAQAATLLGVSVKHLETLRVRGGGPPFERLGRAIRYPRAALLQTRRPG